MRISPLLAALLLAVPAHALHAAPAVQPAALTTLVVADYDEAIAWYTGKLGFQPMCGLEFEWFNFAETPQSWAAKKGVDPTPVTPGMFGYSLLRANANREYFNALMDKLLLFRVPIEGLHTETGPGVYEAALQFSDALECADRGGQQVESQTEPPLAAIRMAQWRFSDDAAAPGRCPPS